MNEKVGRILGLRAVFVEEVENPKTRIAWGHFLRVRAQIDVSSPLKKGCWLATYDGSRVWVDFRYEKRPDYCYICGCLDHNDKDCDKQLELKYESCVVMRLYGNWIRA